MINLSQIQRILLVDDQPIANMLLQRLLKKLNIEADIRDFTSPKQALHNIETELPNLVFLDINMPELSGWKFLDRMPQQANQPHVVIVTSSTSREDESKAKSYATVKGFLHKPVKLSDLEALLGE